MTRQEAFKMYHEESKNSPIVRWIFPDTINQVLMDLYINYQDNIEESVDDRNRLKSEIICIVSSFRSVITKDKINYEIIRNPDQYIDEDVWEVLKYILEPGRKRPISIPGCFQIRLRSVGRVLSVGEFYRYHE